MVFHLFITPSPIQIIVVLVLGVLFFGKNLPDVAKQVGKSLLELRKGLKEIGDIAKDATTSGVPEDHESQSGETHLDQKTDKYESSGTKFEPPPLSS